MAPGGSDHADVVADCNEIAQIARKIQERVEEYRDTDFIIEEPIWSTFENIDPLCSDRQKFMAFYNENIGVKGLSYMVYQIGKEDARLQHEKWKEEQQSKTLAVPASTTMSPGVQDDQMTDSSDQLSEDEGMQETGLCQTDDEEEIQRENDSITHANLWPSQRADRRSQTTTAHSQRAESNQPRDATDDNMQESERNDQASSSSDSDSTVTSTVMTDFRGVSPTWRLILDDYTKNGGVKLLFYLSSIPSQVTSALIRGDLPSKMQDPEFAATTGIALDPRDCQGVYAVYISRNRLPREEKQPVEEVGKGLTLRELRRLVECIQLYIDVGKKGSKAYAKMVDQAFSGRSALRIKLRYSRQRRYGSGDSHDQFRHHKEWLTYIEAYYMEWIQQCVIDGDQSDLDIPLARCFVYVGLGKNVLGRCTNHWNHQGHISPVFGLVCAILQFEYPERFTVQKSTYQILRTVDKDDIGFDEKLITLLCSAYPWDGGLSTAYAGQARGSPKKYDAQHKASLKKSFLAIKDSGMIAKNLEESDRKIEEIQRQMENALVLEGKMREVLKEASAQQKSVEAFLKTLE